MNTIIKEIVTIFQERGNEIYGSEAVTQLQHALQSATLAEEAGASFQLITAALLHDIGHILHTDELPENDEVDLHDFHETQGEQWLSQHFSAAVTQPVQLHVAAKRYLCTVDESYQNQLSPASYKSFLDQGGKMNEAELKSFQENPFFEEAIQLRKWDDLAKDSQKITPDILHFATYIEKAIAINNEQ